MLDIVPATGHHLALLGGPTLVKAARALAVVDGEEVLAIAGYTTQWDCLMVSARISESGRALMAKRYGLKTLLVAAKRIVNDAAHRGLPVRAIADPSIEGSGRLLYHIGFTRVDKETYEWNSQHPC